MMAERPTGTITFLFTDIEGSTGRWEEQTEEMGEALALHDERLRTAIEAGRVAVQTHRRRRHRSVFLAKRRRAGRHCGATVAQSAGSYGDRDRRGRAPRRCTTAGTFRELVRAWRTAICLGRLESHHAAALLAGAGLELFGLASALPGTGLPEILDESRAALGSEKVESLTARGASMTLAEVVRYARDEIARVRELLAAGR